MVKYLVTGLIVLAIFVGSILLGLEIEKDPGLVQIQIRGWTIETSLAIALLATGAAFVLVYIAVRLLGRVTPWKLRKTTAARRQRHANRALQRGIIELSQGHWIKAQKVLSKAVAHEDTAVLGYLMQARAAQALGQTENRDRLLQLAHHSDGNPDMTVGITEAELLIANQQLEQAAHQLRQLHDMDRKNKRVLELLKHCYLESHAWRDLVELMPKLEKAKVVKAEEALHMERNAYTQLLANAAHASDDSRALDAAWNSVPHGLRRDKQMIGVYIRYLIEHGEGSRPESILRHKIKVGWDDDLVYLYGLVDSGNPSSQLQTAERWMKKHAENATLLLTLGRLALRNHLWGKARNYLEQSADLDPRPETYMLLGKLLEQTGENAIAGECFRKGLGISVNKELMKLDRLPIDTDEKSQGHGLPAPAAATPVTVEAAARAS